MGMYDPVIWLFAGSNPVAKGVLNPTDNTFTITEVNDSGIFGTADYIPQMTNQIDVGPLWIEARWPAKYYVYVSDQPMGSSDVIVTSSSSSSSSSSKSSSSSSSKSSSSSSKSSSSSSSSYSSSSSSQSSSSSSSSISSASSSSTSSSSSSSNSSSSSSSRSSSSVSSSSSEAPAPCMLLTITGLTTGQSFLGLDNGVHSVLPTTYGSDVERWMAGTSLEELSIRVNEDYKTYIVVKGQSPSFKFYGNWDATHFSHAEAGCTYALYGASICSITSKIKDHSFGMVTINDGTHDITISWQRDASGWAGNACP